MGRKAQLLCAECLGLLGAVDPARLDVKAEPPASLHSLTLPLLKELISKHLVRLLRVATSLPVLEATTFAIQVLSLSLTKDERTGLLAVDSNSQKTTCG